MNLNELKKKSQKESVEDAFCRLFLRNISIRITKFLVGTRVTPNQITALSFSVGVLAAFCFAVGEYAYHVAGAILIQISLIFDLVDGEVARVKSMQSSAGAWLESLLDIVRTGLLFMGMALGLQTQTDYVLIWSMSYLAFFGLVIGSYSSSRQLEIYGHSSVSEAKEESNPRFVRKLYNDLYGLGSITLVLSVGAILNQLVVSIIIVAISSNLDWVSKFAWYYGKQKEKGNVSPTGQPYLQRTSGL